ncbi:O-antigen ligase family protein [Myxococcota bacterium]|nr:O-antigen ligase family protein [Myxococcota bacterium]
MTGARWPASRRGLVPMGLGLLAGGAVAVSPVLPALLLGALVVAWLGLSSPPFLVGLMYVAMLFDQAGVAGIDVARLPVTASKLAVLGSLGMWAAHAMLTGRKPVRWHPVLGGLLTMVVATGLSIAVVGSMHYGIFDLAGLAMLTVLVGLVYAALAEADLAGVYRACAIALALILLSNMAAASGGGRSTGTMGDPNEWGAMLLLLTPWLLGGLAWDDHALARPLRLAMLGLPPIAIMMTQSRAAFVAAMVVLPLSVLLVRHRRGELSLAALAALVAAPVAVDVDAALSRYRTLVDKLTGTAAVEDNSLNERAELGRQAWDLFVEHPLLGVGPGEFQTESGFIPLEGHLLPPHNTYLQIACEQGIVGLLATAVLGLAVTRTLARGYRRARDPQGRARVLGAALGLAAIALMAVTLGLLTLAMAYLVLGFTLAVVHQEVEDVRHA